ncbi:MAG: DUF333 domain-containing protein [Candidatus Paceibacterota bacterium]
METISDESAKSFKAIGSFLFVCLFCVFGFIFTNNTAMAADNVEEIAKPVLLPNSPLYFLKDIGREIQSFFVFDPAKKAELRLEFSNQKLIEAKKIFENDPSNTEALNKALDSYASETDKLKKAASVLKKDSVSSNQLLTKITEQNFNHQQILNEISGADKIKVEQTQSKSIENFTASSFNLASPQAVQKNIQDNLNKDTLSAQKVEKMDVVAKMDSGASVELKKEVMKVQDNLLQQTTGSPFLSVPDKLKINQYLEELKAKPEFKNVILEDFAKNIVSQNKEEINQLNTLSDADKEKLKLYAEQILNTEKIDFADAMNKFEALDISQEARQTINKVTDKITSQNIVSGPTTAANIGMANPASAYCVKQGYKLEIRKDAQGNETGYCIFSDGKECEEWKFFRGECPDNSSR